MGWSERRPSESFLADGYDVIALSRRRPEVATPVPFRHLALDLRDAAAHAGDAVAELGDVTHVVYAAVYETPGLVPGWREPGQMETEPGDAAQPDRAAAAAGRPAAARQPAAGHEGLRRPPPPDARSRRRERYPRDQHENFYWLQEDYIRETSAAGGLGVHASGARS